MDDVRSIKPEKSLSSVFHKPVVYTNIDDVLAANEKWKAEQVDKYRKALTLIEDSIRAAQSYYIDRSLEEPDNPEVIELSKKIMTLKRKAIKLRQMINDYEKKDW